MRRDLVALAVVVLAVAVISLPANAGPTPAVATATFTNDGSCNVTVTYTWSGFRGHNLTASYGVYYQGTGGIDVGILFQNDNPVTGSGTSTHQFSLAGKGSHTYYGRGNLLSAKLAQVKNSDAASSTTAPLSC